MNWCWAEFTHILLYLANIFQVPPMCQALCKRLARDLFQGAHLPAGWAALRSLWFVCDRHVDRVLWEERKAKSCI